jgi:hypothetical protein
LTQKSTTKEVVKILEKYQRLHIKIKMVTLKMTLGFYGKTNLFFGTVPFNPWVILATWLHAYKLLKIHKEN